MRISQDAFGDGSVFCNIVMTGSAQLRLDWQDPSAMGLSVKEIEAMTSFNPEVVIVGCSDENLAQMLSKCSENAEQMLVDWI